MSATRMQINGSDRDTLRLFVIDLPPEAVERFVTEAGTGEWPLKYALGASRLRGGFVDVVALRDLGEMPLSRYLTDAHGATGEDFRQLAPQIDALQGHVLILPAQAFDSTSQELTIAAPLRHVGTFGEVRAQGRGPALRSASASGQGTGSAPVSAPRLPWLARVLAGLVLLAGGVALVLAMR